MSSLGRLLSILDLYSETKPIWTLEDITLETGFARSTAYRYVKELCDSGLLMSIGKGAHVLGPRFIEFDRLIRNNDPLLIASQRIMPDLLGEFGEGVLDSIFDGGSDKEMEIADDQAILDKDQDELNIIVKDEKTDYVPEPVLTEKQVEIQDAEIETRYINKFKRNNINALDSLIDPDNPIKTAIILKEVFDKPRSLRKKIR